MKECCNTCARQYKAHKTDFTKLRITEPIDSEIDGYICMAFADERIAVLIVGNDPDSAFCEVYTPRAE